MKTAQYDYFHQFCEVRDETSALSLGSKFRADGFTAVRRFLDEFRDYLRQFGDAECQQASERLQLARAMLPNPGEVSPSWVNIWKEYDSIIRTKRVVLGSIPVTAREGEWQVLLDNPHSNQNIAVYPGLTFMEAIYMFAYFRSDMMPSEYIRLQKIDTLLTFTGVDRKGFDE
ncbi:hypothetical protein [Paenibacillus spongiae]|uniref:DUF2313 domain-containing protein n=1 Tax=Paenibacillus spongiae TaxID=2909671 RepID=A0ABY5S243_9BACL|nr:hypothetical protein [Paenibacillus spongiae]UVI27635.1 hypothetical protein L1F29_19405 [Paenibacillus spongiae]